MIFFFFQIAHLQLFLTVHFVLPFILLSMLFLIPTSLKSYFWWRVCSEQVKGKKSTRSFLQTFLYLIRTAIVPKYCSMALDQKPYLGPEGKKLSEEFTIISIFLI